MTEDGLDKHDPLRKAKRAAKKKRGRKATKAESAPPARARASSTKQKRGVRTSPPQALKHAVYRRAEGYCEYPGCRCRTGLQLAHVHPHATGGPWHVKNVVLLCPAHHTMLDAGRLVFLGYGAKDGRPRFQKRVVSPQKGARGPPGR